MNTEHIDTEQATHEATLAAPGAVRAAALWYAERGLPVFPVNGKIPYPGTRGFKDATLDPDQIVAWYKKWPQAGVAAPTGILYDAVDIDGPPGWATMAGVAHRGGFQHIDQLFPVTYGKVATPRGRHILVPTKGRGNGAAVVGPGVDIRGAGGYTVLPPSKRDGQVAYRWIAPPTFPAAG